MRLVTLVSAALIAGSGLTVAASSAEAQRWHDRGHHRWHGRDHHGPVRYRYYQRRHVYYHGPWRRHFRERHVVCNRVWYHHRHVRSCRTVWY